MDDIDTMDIKRPAPGHIAPAFSRTYEGATAPNLPVGCVLLDAAGTQLASGAHH